MHLFKEWLLEAKAPKMQDYRATQQKAVRASIKKDYDAQLKHDGFDWKRPGTGGGSFVVHLRFEDEGRGESFFDKQFAVWPGKTTKNSMDIGREVTSRGVFVKADPSSSLVKALKPGTQLTLTINWHGSRGVKTLKASWVITVKSAKKNSNGTVRLEY